MPRVIWKGAISFGLVHIPVVLHAASTETGIHFDLVDRRTADPIGYRRVNKVTGEVVENDQIVRAYEYQKGHYVMLGDDEIKSANVASTQTVDIQGFIDREELPFLFLEKPYYLAPDKRGAKVYALLRDALARAGKVGIATVVMHTKQHLAALIPQEQILVLNTLRWADEVNDPEPILAATDAAARASKSGGRGAETSASNPRGASGASGARGARVTALGRGDALATSAGPSEAELAMAQKLIDDMSTPWDPQLYHDTFRDDILELVERKVAAGKTHVIEHPDVSAGDEGPLGDVIDLTELLKRSLRERPGQITERSRAADARVLASKSGARRDAKVEPREALAPRAPRVPVEEPAPKRRAKGGPKRVEPSAASGRTRSSTRRTRASA